MLYVHALASNRTFPSGRVAAGPSVLAYCSSPTGRDLRPRGPRAHRSGLVLIQRGLRRRVRGARAWIFVRARTSPDHEHVPARHLGLRPDLDDRPRIEGDCRSGASAPEKVHVSLPGLNSCEPPTAAHTSTVRTWPLGSSVHPSSSLGSSLPVAGITFQVRFFALSNASSTVGSGSVRQVLHGCWSMKVPSSRTSLAASPMFVQPRGGATERQLSVAGS